MMVLLIAPHRKAEALLKLLRRDLHLAKSAGSFDAAKRFLGQGEDLIVFTPEVAADVVKGFGVLKEATEARLLYVVDFPTDGFLWQLLSLGIDGYATLDAENFRLALSELEMNRYGFVE